MAVSICYKNAADTDSHVPSSSLPKDRSAGAAGRGRFAAGFWPLLSTPPTSASCLQNFHDNAKGHAMVRRRVGQGRHPAVQRPACWPAKTRVSLSSSSPRVATRMSNPAQLTSGSPLQTAWASWACRRCQRRQPQKLARVSAWRPWPPWLPAAPWTRGTSWRPPSGGAHEDAKPRQVSHD